MIYLAKYFSPNFGVICSSTPIMTFHTSRNLSGIFNGVHDGIHGPLSTSIVFSIGYRTEFVVTQA